jgi:hypothetical protein
MDEHDNAAQEERHAQDHDDVQTGTEGVARVPILRLCRYAAGLRWTRHGSVRAGLLVRAPAARHDGINRA